MENKVTTVSGEIVPRRQTRRIDGSFYKIGDVKIENSGDCYKINGRYYREETGYIGYDHRIKEYIILSEGLLKDTLVGFNRGEMVIKKASRIEGTLPRILYLNNGSKVDIAPNVNLIKNLKFRRDRSTGNYFEVTGGRHNYLSSSNISSNNRHVRLARPDKNGLRYNVDSETMKISNNYLEMYSQYRSIYESKVNNGIAKLIKDYTFGLEFETVRGVIPNRYTMEAGLIPLRDGSISGLEYATVPLSGKEGLLALDSALESLDLFTEYDSTCSLHFHIGGLVRDEIHILAFTKLVYEMQDNLYRLFPFYKRDNYGVKGKNYTRPFSNSIFNSIVGGLNVNVKESFHRLFRYLSNGNSYFDYGESLSNVHNHPSDPNNDRKWNINPRYHLINLIPIIFTNKKTVEFRLHTPTTDPIKIKAFMALCSAMVHFVNRHAEGYLNGRVDVPNNHNRTNPNLIGGILRWHFNEVMSEDERYSYRWLLDDLMHYFNIRLRHSDRMIRDGVISYDEDEMVLMLREFRVLGGSKISKFYKYKNKSNEESSSLRNQIESGYIWRRNRGRRSAVFNSNTFSIEIPDTIETQASDMSGSMFIDPFIHEGSDNGIDLTDLRNQSRESDINRAYAEAIRAAESFRINDDE